LRFPAYYIYIEKRKEMEKMEHGVDLSANSKQIAPFSILL